MAAARPLHPTWAEPASFTSITASWMEGRVSVACLPSRATTTSDGRVRMHDRHSPSEWRTLGKARSEAGARGNHANCQDPWRGVYNIFSFSSTALAVNPSPRAPDKGNQHELPRARNAAAAMPRSSHQGQGPLRPTGAPCGCSAEDASGRPSM